MNYKTLKEKYEKILNALDYNIESHKNSDKMELVTSVSALEQGKEEAELILKAINNQIQNCKHEHKMSYNHGYHTVCLDCGEKDWE